MPKVVKCAHGVKVVIHISGPVVAWLKVRPGDWKVAGSIPESTDFLTNSSGQAT